MCETVWCQKRSDNGTSKTAEAGRDGNAETQHMLQKLQHENQLLKKEIFSLKVALTESSMKLTECERKLRYEMSSQRSLVAAANKAKQAAEESTFFASLERERRIVRVEHLNRKLTKLQAEVESRANSNGNEKRVGYEKITPV